MATSTDPFAPPNPASTVTGPARGRTGADHAVRVPPPPPPGAGRGHWVWVEGPRQWAGLDLPLVRDPIFWVWALFMLNTTVFTIITQANTDKAVSILVVSWVACTIIYWFIPALARQVFRQVRTARKARAALSVDRYPAAPGG